MFGEQFRPSRVFVIAALVAAFASLERASAQDCNGNGVPDDQDIAQGTSLDCNGNGIPDECDALAAVVLSDWDDLAGNWSLAANWCPAGVPNNGGGITYQVSISGSNSIVHLDTSPIVDELKINDCARLEVDVVNFTAVLGLVEIDSGGKYLAKSDGVLPTGASLTADTITLLKTGAVGGQMLLQDTMSVNTAGDVTLQGLAEACVTSDPCGGRGLGRGGTSPPVIRVTSSSFRAVDVGSPRAVGSGPSLTVGGAMNLNNTVRVEVGEGPGIRLSGDFNNHAISATCFLWDLGTLTLTGGTMINPQVFEMAGENLGADELGFVNNFAIGKIVVDPGVVVDFVNDCDNTVADCDLAPPPGSCQVQYVDTLVLGSGSTVRLHGCNVYYRCLIADPSATVDISDGGHLAQVGTGSCAAVSVAAFGPLGATIMALSLLGTAVWQLRRPANELPKS